MASNSFAGKLYKGIMSRLSRTSRNPWKEVNVSWFVMKYYKHLPAGKLRTHQLFGRKLFFRNPAEFLHGLKEIFIERLYKQELPPHPYIIDCGANIGLSVIYMKRLYPMAEIVAFEPDEQNFDVLSRNIQSFGFTGITLRREAVWKENTVLRFSGQGSTTSRIDSTAGASSGEVQAVRLKDLLVRHIDFLKIDIEGAEFQVVKDLGGSLHHVGNLFIEYHGSFRQNTELSELLQFLNDNRFHYYIKEAAPSYETPFYRKEKHDIPFDIQLNIFCFRDAEAGN